MAQRERLKILSEITNKIILYYFINKKNTNILLPIARAIQCMGGHAKDNYCLLRTITVHWMD